MSRRSVRFADGTNGKAKGLERVATPHAIKFGNYYPTSDEDEVQYRTPESAGRRLRSSASSGSTIASRTGRSPSSSRTLSRPRPILRTLSGKKDGRSSPKERQRKSELASSQYRTPDGRFARDPSLAPSSSGSSRPSRAPKKTRGSSSSRGGTSRQADETPQHRRIAREESTGTSPEISWLKFSRDPSIAPSSPGSSRPSKQIRGFLSSRTSRQEVETPQRGRRITREESVGTSPEVSWLNTSSPKLPSGRYVKEFFQTPAVQQSFAEFLKARKERLIADGVNISTL